MNSSNIYHDLPQSSKSDYRAALAHMKDNGIDMYDNSLCFKNTSGAVFPPQKYLSESFKRSHLEDCVFSSSYFDDCSWTSSVFQNVSFQETTFDNSNGSFCNFNKCRFVNETPASEECIKGSNFSYANIIECVFDNINIINSSFDNVFFHNTSFSNGKIAMSTLESSVFYQCSLNNMNLNNLNLDFAEFRQVSMTDVELPFYQLPYIFGGLSYFLHTSDTVWVSGHETGWRKISSDEYKTILPDLITYYQHYQEYFPVVNIYLALGDMNSALQALYFGIENSAAKKDFRMLKFFCKLAAKSQKFSYAKLQEIYDKIYGFQMLSNMSPHETRLYFSQLGEIRRILLFDDSDKVTMDICMQTNILTENSEKTGILIREIENIMAVFQDTDTIYSIELKHHCPWDAIITIIAMQPIIELLSKSFEAIFAPAATLLTIIATICKINQSIAEKRLSDQQSKLNDLQIEQQSVNLEITKKQLEIAQYQAEREKLLTEAARQQYLSNNQPSIDTAKLTNAITAAHLELETNQISAQITINSNV